MIVRKKTNKLLKFIRNPRDDFHEFCFKIIIHASFQELNERGSLERWDLHFVGKSNKIARYVTIVIKYRKKQVSSLIRFTWARGENLPLSV